MNIYTYTHSIAEDHYFSVGIASFLIGFFIIYNDTFGLFALEKSKIQRSDNQAIFTLFWAFMAALWPISYPGLVILAAFCAFLGFLVLFCELCKSLPSLVDLLDKAEQKQKDKLNGTEK